MKTCRTTSLQRPDANHLTKRHNVMKPIKIPPTDGIAHVDDHEPRQEYRYTKSQITQVVSSDIDLTGQVETRQSTSGLMVYLNGVLVHWRGRTERLILQTTAAGEYVALNRANTTAKLITYETYSNSMEIKTTFTIYTQITRPLNTLPLN